MRNLKTLLLAGTLAAAALMTSTTADAGRWHRHYGYYGGGWNPGGALVAGTVLGLAIGSLAAPRYYYDPYPPYYAYPPAPPYVGSDPHIDWCTATYRSYNGETDTWVDASGVARRCLGPQ